MMKTFNKGNKSFVEAGQSKASSNQSTLKSTKQLNMYASNGSIIKEFITKPENNSDPSVEKRCDAFVNHFGFVTALHDGLNCDANKKMEVILPDTADLSITQNGGFSIYFWILIKKQANGAHRFLVKRGNTVEEMTPSIGLLPNGTNLFIKMVSSKHRIETLLSNKKIETDRMYALCVTFAIDYSEGLTDISLYLDGLIDSQITVPGEPLHNQGSLWIGKPDSMNHGFYGTIADIILIPRVLEAEEILQITQEGVLNLFNSRGQFIKTYEIVERKFERDYLIHKYAEYTDIPLDVIERIEISNDELREIVKKFDKELQNMESQDKTIPSPNEDEIVLNKLRDFIAPIDSENYNKVKKLATKGRFIYTVLFLANDMENEMDQVRIVSIFEILSETVYVNIDLKFLTSLAENLNSYSNKMIQLQSFFKNLKNAADVLYPELKDYNNIQTTSDFNSVEMHENLLRSSQMFKNYIEEENERDLKKSSFSINSLYSRIKSSKPTTVYGNERHGGDDDIVNQHYNDIIHEGDKEFMEEEEDQQPVESPIKEEPLQEEKPSEKESSQGSMSNPSQSNSNAKKVDDLLVDNNENVNSGESLGFKKRHSLLSNQGDRGMSRTGTVKGNIEGKVSQVEQGVGSLDEEIIPISAKENTEVPVNNNPVTKQGQNDGKNSNNPENNSNKELENVTQKKEEQEEKPKELKETDTEIKSAEGATTYDGMFLSDLNQKVDFNTPNGEMNNDIRDNNNSANKTQMTEKDPNDIDPRYPTNWNEGAFELSINYCYDCHTHKTTTRHYEFTFVEKFNEIGDFIKTLFPNIRIVGNSENLEYLGSFDVYLRGLGPRQDDLGRFFLYRKLHTKKFPSAREIADKLVAIALIYGSSTNMEVAQQQYLKAYENSFPKKSKYFVEHPSGLSDTAEQIKTEYYNMRQKPPSDDPERTKLSCLNWGCNSIYVQIDNGDSKCLFHPGVWQFGSYNGYWPEAWSCCERAWNEPGCTRGRHNGVRVDKRQHLCLQHGEPNPLNNHPDSACGKYFTIKEDDGCKYHPGYTKDGSWTCCGADKQIKDGCNEGKHVTIPWPDEKAKLNFYPKSYNNPGLKYSQNKSSITKVDLATLILTCDYFKEIKPYDNPITKLELLKMKREKEKDEPRYCLRWACEKIYKDTENIDASCVCHPGKWDHGSTGTKMTQFVMEMKSDPKSLEKQTILWKPHWTCCRSDWNSPGCRRMTHRGPLLEELEKYGKKYKWPDARLKLSFNKVVSEKWKEFIKQYSYPPEKVQAICKKFFSEGRKYIHDLPILCDALRLYLIVIDEKVQFQMKFMDIATQSGTVAYFLNKDNSVDCDKFIKWWYLDYAKIVSELNPNANYEIVPKQDKN